MLKIGTEPGKDEGMKSFHVRLSDRLKSGERIALAAILEAKGSAPQTAGAAALFSERKLVDTVGGGALEAAAGKAASRALRAGDPVVFDRALGGKDLAEDEEVCGGEVKVLVDPRPGRHKSVFAALARSVARGRRGVLATMISVSPGGRTVVKRDWIEASSRSSLDREIVAAFADGAPRLAKVRVAGRGGTAAEDLLFIEPVFPPCRLVVAGAGHVGRAVARLGNFLEFEVTVIDDRRAFANRANLPDADTIVCADIGAALRAMPISPDTYIVIVTRGHRHDTEALRACIRSGAGYIGMIGSRSKIALQREEFIRRRWATAAAFDRVHAPVGIPIRSKTVPEIAVSVAAELVLARRENMEKGGCPA
jgi:xanthine dehydrogenase accessory factor